MNNDCLLTGMQPLQQLEACSCQIRCCAEHTSPRRLPPYTNQPHVYHESCCGCVYCPSFIGPGPFFPVGMPMLTPLASIQMAISAQPYEVPDAPDQPDVPDVPDVQDVPDVPELILPDPPEIKSPEIKGPEEVEQDSAESLSNDVESDTLSEFSTDTTNSLWTDAPSKHRYII